MCDGPQAGFAGGPKSSPGLTNQGLSVILLAYV
jgi:hypothetical protein